MRLFIGLHQKNLWLNLSMLFSLVGAIFMLTSYPVSAQKSLSIEHARRRGQPPQSVWIVGDSLTRGLFASTEQYAYRNLLFDSLRALYPGSIHSTFWMGVCTLAGLENQWDSFVGTPDLIFIELGINDLGNPNCPQVPKDQWQARYGAMLDRIMTDAPNVEIIVGTIPWCNWTSESESYANAQMYNRWIQEEARARLIPVADLWSATRGRIDGISTPDQPSVFPPYYHGDHFHPNDIGHQRLARTFFLTYLQSRFQQLYLPLQFPYTFSSEQ